MEGQLSISKREVYSGTYIEKAWYLVAVLLSIGRPVSPIELAGKCSMFSISPDLIGFLCFIPDSPICLSENGVVLLSSVAFRVVGEFFASSVVSEVQIDVFGSMMSFFSRFGSGIGPLLKEIVVTRLIEGSERQNELETSSSYRRTVLALKAPPLDVPMVVALADFSDKAVTPSMVISNTALLEYQSKKDEDENEGNGSKLIASQIDDTHNYIASEIHQDAYHNIYKSILDMPETQSEGCGGLIFESLEQILAFLGLDEPEPVDLTAKIDIDASPCPNLYQHDKNTGTAVVDVHPQKDFIGREIPETSIEDVVEQPLNELSFHEEIAEKEKPSFGSFDDILCHKSIEIPKGDQQTLLEEIPNNEASNQALDPAKTESGCQKIFSNLSAVPENVPQIEPVLKHTAPPNLQQNSKVDILHKDKRGRKDQTTIASADNSKQICKKDAAVNDKCENKPCKEQDKSKYPKFESYVVEEEEGSGGYGTVYRARRRTDGVTFAIKCPHANAHIHHLKNELKMLQRFGGKNFIIKLEGSLKSGNADCFVLEHVEHDRAEALKKEINVDQLQWYGYCLFKALSSLHKQGVFHRDVKPGNFLFSCKTSKGYLIDFNLAKDLHKTAGIFEQSRPSYTSAAEHVPAPQYKFDSPNKRRKILRGKPSEAIKAGATSGTNHTIEGKTLKRKAVDKLKAYDDLSRRKTVTSQCADGSGLTSKDVTSTRTSKERLREPIPSQGRKELINLAQEAMLNPNLGSAPLSKRKRVTASPVLMDPKFIYLTPTPLHSSGNCIPDAGSWKNRAGVKPPKEGPCVGTKGFRAPEVLLRSVYQGPKIDVWSAGVTLLYLITGKLPFTGDPEQNMKDIVKMKGNEDLWEVAKLHNREFSFPQELLDIRFLQSMTIKEWCIANTKRSKFLDAIPNSLFDLIEKCLTVNPRLRITSEEASRHDFFAPCHDYLQTLKLRRLSQDQRSRSNSLPLLSEPVVDK